MTPEELEVFGSLLLWCEGYQKLAHNLRSKPDTSSLDEAVRRGKEVLQGVTV